MSPSFEGQITLWFYLKVIHRQQLNQAVSRYSFQAASNYEKVGLSGLINITSLSPENFTEVASAESADCKAVLKAAKVPSLNYDAFDQTSPRMIMSPW